MARNINCVMCGRMVKGKGTLYAYCSEYCEKAFRDRINIKEIDPSKKLKAIEFNKLLRESCSDYSKIKQVNELRNEIF